MVGAVGDQDDRLPQVSVQGGQDRQPRGARQGQAGQEFARVQIRQQALISRERADLVEEKLHAGYRNQLFSEKNHICLDPIRDVTTQFERGCKPTPMIVWISEVWILEYLAIKLDDMVIARNRPLVNMGIRRSFLIGIVHVA
jgi:hypothetical protein